MITKKSLFRKISIISLAVLIFVSSLLGASVNTANAVGVDTVVKLVGGKAIVRALAEKAGMTLSKKQIDNVAGYIERKSYDGDQKAIDFINSANSATGVINETKPGWKKYLLDPMIWLTGLDLLFTAIDAFSDAYDSGSPVIVYGSCPAPVTPIYNAGFVYFKVPNPELPTGFAYYQFSWDNSKFVTRIDVNGVMWYDNLADIKTKYARQKSLDGGVTWQYTAYYDNLTANAGTSNVIVGPPFTRISGTGDIECSTVPKEDDLVNVSNVNTTIINNFDNDTYNTNTTYVIEADIPDSPNYDDSVPWNEPDQNIPTEVNPVPADTDNDGIPDETDSDSDEGKGFLENLLAIATLLVIFDLLKAVIFYLARMFEFILTIPLIEAKPIDNVAFEWFRNAEIIGVEIYSVVSTLASIGLAFAVYKVVRRLLP